MVGGGGNGVFGYGDAQFHGSTGDLSLHAPVAGMAGTETRGHWVPVGRSIRDGGVFAFGDAPFEGSGGLTAPASPRLVSPAPTVVTGSPTAQNASPIPAIGSYVSTRVANVTVAIDDLATGQTYAYRPGVVEHTASTVKVDILGTLLTEAQAAGRPFTAAEHHWPSHDRRQPRQRGQRAVGPTRAGGRRQHRAPGRADPDARRPTGYGAPRPRPPGPAGHGAAVAFPEPVLTDSSRGYILNLMEHITPSQAWGVTGGVPPGVTVALKNGFSIINGWQINSMEWVNGDGRDYLIAVFTDGNPTEPYGIATVDAISAIVWNPCG